MTNTLLKNGLALVLGGLIGILFHYCLYRFSLPATSFIYAAF